MKICNKCNLSKESKFFGKDKRNKDGLQGTCETCRKLNKAARREEIKSGINIKILDAQECVKCHTIKNIHDFYRDAGFSSGFSSICKSCKDIKTKIYREVKNEEYNEYMRKYRQTHPEKYGKARNRGLKHRYGISQEQYDQMFLNQQGNCAICKKHQSEFNKPLFVDHDHNTNEVRGLLCSGCNVTIAIFDNKPLLDQAKDYLKK